MFGWLCWNGLAPTLNFCLVGGIGLWNGCEIHSVSGSHVSFSSLSVSSFLLPPGRREPQPVLPQLRPPQNPPPPAPPRSSPPAAAPACRAARSPPPRSSCQYFKVYLFLSGFFSLNFPIVLVKWYWSFFFLVEVILIFIFQKDGLSCLHANTYHCQLSAWHDMHTFLMQGLGWYHLFPFYCKTHRDIPS